MLSFSAQVEYTFPKLSSFLLLPVQISRILEAGLSEIHPDRLINTMLTVLDDKDRYTLRHSLRVTKIATLISRDMNLPDKQCRRIRNASILHDIGKIAIPNRILHKTGGLNGVERQKMEAHSQIGYSILRHLPLLSEYAPIVLSHHERWDGLGYPNHLQQQQIPLESRTIAIADTFDAITSNRPYRKGLSMERGVEEIVNHQEDQFDPMVVKHFLRIRHQIPQDAQLPPKE